MFRWMINKIRRAVLVARIFRLGLQNRFSQSSMTEIGGPVVSLTTYGKRARTVFLTIESIAAGEVRPSRILLWLDDVTVYQKLPSVLRRLQERGLEIRLCRNYGPHTKYYPYIESEEDFLLPLVTADDDIIYPRYWLKHLLAAWREVPETVSCYRARVVSLAGRSLAPYSTWQLCSTQEESSRLLATGVSGVIYPPAFQKALKKAGDSFKQCCPRADDLWLHVQALRTGVKVRQIGKRAVHFAIIPWTQEGSLYSQNVVQADGNDRQISATYTDSDIVNLAREGVNLAFEDDQSRAGGRHLHMESSAR